MTDISCLTQEVLKLLAIVKPTTQQINLLTAVLSILLEKPQIHANKYLSPREKNCLYLLAQGKKLEEISTIMAVKPTTIATFIKRIKSKLECHTLAQAVYEGLVQDQIPTSKRGHNNV